ncbi:unnamed protein product [Callosobruchus maculatus]|uniref:BZIP domain-containing protein n=1 Tax=Callosobruchus maculatus TaxID=64391 RepID=A0A653BWP2_CALMS|nr:unnamed protein product [Callosobruchus maculatus]
MSRGIASEFQRLFGQVDELKRQGRRVGQVLELRSGQRRLYYLISKEKSYQKPTYRIVWEALLDLREKLLTADVLKQAIPRLACGRDGLDWRLIRNMLQALFNIIGGSQNNFVQSVVITCQVEVLRKRHLMQIYGNINEQAPKPTRNMVSKGKRNKYELSSSEDESIEDHCDDPGYVPNMDIKTTTRTSTRGRKPKCFTKNAMMARENRLKKKMYISKLEQDVDLLRKENKNLTAVVDNQSMLISDLRKEVKYLKSVIANSSDIGCLIRAINQNTSLPLRTSLDKKLCQPTGHTPNPIQTVEKQIMHPWEEKPVYPCYPTPEDDSHSLCSEQKIDDTLTSDLFDLEFPIEMPDEDLLKDLTFDEKNVPMMDEHNYTNNNDKDSVEEDNVGVCLHVNKHRVSLEFCPTCSENASQVWNS